MRNPSHLAGCARRAPTQQRGIERVSRLLDAAVAEFAASGYEGATMNAIAQRAESPIGSLYQFFPNKEALARALRARQIDDAAALWSELGRDPRCAAIDVFVRRFVRVMTEFVASHPAFLPLLDAPSSTLPPGARDRLRQLIAEQLQVVEPRLGAAQRRRCATVMLAVNKALMSIYAEADAADRKRIVVEYRELLRSYLGARSPGATKRGEDA